MEVYERWWEHWQWDQLFKYWYELVFVNLQHLLETEEWFQIGTKDFRDLVIWQWEVISTNCRSQKGSDLRSSMFPHTLHAQYDLNVSTFEMPGVFGVHRYFFKNAFFYFWIIMRFDSMLPIIDSDSHDSTEEKYSNEWNELVNTLSWCCLLVVLFVKWRLWICSCFLSGELGTYALNNKHLNVIILLITIRT